MAVTLDTVSSAANVFLFHNNIICQSCQNIIKKNKEKPKDESKRCTECGRWLIRFMSLSRM